MGYMCTLFDQVTHPSASLNNSAPRVFSWLFGLKATSLPSMATLQLGSKSSPLRCGFDSCKYLYCLYLSRCTRMCVIYVRDDNYYDVRLRSMENV